MSEKTTNAEVTFCEHCGRELTVDEVCEFDGVTMCRECLDDRTVVCECCGDRIWNENDYGDDSICLCESCRDENYTRCYHCDTLLNNDDVYYDDDDTPYCYHCYHDCCSSPIHDYAYKPEPVFYGDSDRFFGVELEIDGGGKDKDNADTILDAVNGSSELIYIKSDGSLNEGLEIVTHPMSLDFHKNKMPWIAVADEALRLDYLSHKTSTCGLHIHVNRTTFGQTREAQDDCVSRVLYFVEHHWEELLKFSRRTESQMNRWAARYGYKDSPREVMDNAKKKGIGRYACVNLTNYNTIEFRMFRGTLKVNTIIATLELVNIVCDMAVKFSDDEISKLSWTDFVLSIPESEYPELIMYLKERRLYVNEPIEDESEEV